MSYCDLGSVGITLEFHSIVETQALIPGVNNASCLNTCDELESSCGNSIYGCTDPIAENYNPQANINDNSCNYKTDFSIKYLKYKHNFIAIKT